MTLLTRLSTGWKAYILLALMTFSASLPGVFGVPALDRDESRFAQASKQMLETGDYIQIRYQDEGRYKKPAGIHWLQAATGSLGKGIDPGDGQIWAYRLPSLLGAILATLATFWCGKILIGQRSAFLGAMLFGAGLLLTSEAHIAKTDAVLAGLTALAMAALARAYAGPSTPRMAFVFWAVLGLSFLIKGPVTLFVAGLAIGVICVAERDLRLGKWALNGRAMVLFAVLVLPWFIWVQVATDGAFLDGALGKDLKDKFAGASEGHGGPPGYHLAFLTLMFFPATLVLVPALVLAARTLRGKALDVLAAEKAGLLFLAAWAVPTWIFFELLPTKLPHYILPAYPALALMCGWGAVQMMGSARARVSHFVSLALFAIGGLALCFVASPWGAAILQNEAAGDFKFAASKADVLAAWDALPDMPLYLLMAGVMALLGAVFTGALRRYGASLTLAIAASVLVGWHVRTVFLPGAVWMQPTVTARAALGEVCGLQGWTYKGCHLPPPGRVQAVGYAEPSFVFTTGTGTVIPPQTLVALPETGAGYPLVYLLNLEDAAGRAALDRLEALAATAQRPLLKSTVRYALNYSNGDPGAFIAVRID